MTSVPVKAIPDDYHQVTPYLLVPQAAKLIDFAVAVFGADEGERLALPNGTIMHAQVRIGDATIMIGEATGDMDPLPGALYVYVEDTDATYQKALGAGAISVMEPADQFYGDRNAGVRDPFGNHWWIATRLENLTSEQLHERAAEAMKQRGQ